jgi:translocator protein
MNAIHDNKKYLWLVVFILLCEAAGILGGLATYSSVKTWYPTLQKPFLNPPAWIFGPVWTILYFLMGIAVWRIHQSSNQTKHSAILVFFVHLALNTAWSFLFFGLRSPLYGFIGILVLLAAIIFTMFKFSKISKSAFWLMLPYLLWVSFATYLSFNLWRLNG